LLVAQGLEAGLGATDSDDARALLNTARALLAFPRSGRLPIVARKGRALALLRCPNPLATDASMARTDVLALARLLEGACVRPSFMFSDNVMIILIIMAVH
jgi:hypothetical protein